MPNRPPTPAATPRPLYTHSGCRVVTDTALPGSTRRRQGRLQPPGNGFPRITVQRSTSSQQTNESLRIRDEYSPDPERSFPARCIPGHDAENGIDGYCEVVHCPLHRFNLPVHPIDKIRAVNSPDKQCGRLPQEWNATTVHCNSSSKGFRIDDIDACWSYGYVVDVGSRTWAETCPAVMEHCAIMPCTPCIKKCSQLRLPFASLKPGSRFEGRRLPGKSEERQHLAPLPFFLGSLAKCPPFVFISGSCSSTRSLPVVTQCCMAVRTLQLPAFRVPVCFCPLWNFLTTDTALRRKPGMK